MSPDWQAPLAMGATLVATPLLAWISLKSGFWTDSKSAGQEWRKPRQQAVALVGGAAVCIGLACSGVRLPWAALCTAFLLGTWDDVRPIGAGWKLLGQALAGYMLGLDMGWAGWDLAQGMGAAVVAQNAMNTWDHADGLCAGLAGMALPPVLAGPFLGFLPWNLLLMRRDKGSTSTGVPWAYLGDAGSHLSGILMIWYLPARLLLFLPLLDLMRVVWLRYRSGAKIWVGDRRHLAHRIQDSGMDPRRAALLALMPALPLLAVDAMGTLRAILVCLGLWGTLLWYFPAPAASHPDGSCD